MNIHEGSFEYKKIVTLSTKITQNSRDTRVLRKIDFMHRVTVIK